MPLTFNNTLTMSELENDLERHEPEVGIEDVSAPPIVFQRWGGEDGIEQFIKRKTGCKPFSGAGINPRPEQKTTILKSVDDTFYYDDDLSDHMLSLYTLFGPEGDQSESNIRFNEPLLNPNKTRDIYLYRVRKNGQSNEYLWYGKYKIVGKNTKQHIGKDYNMRSIIVLSLNKIGN